MLINTVEDLHSSQKTQEKEAFLLALYNDFITFDDTEYPDDYNHNLTSEDDDYIAPVLRQEWNAGAAAGWGFTNRDELTQLLN